MKQIMQGDAYSIPVSIRAGATEITPDMVESVEVMVGDVAKSYPEQMEYDDSWIFTLTQQESFELCSTLQPVQVRVKFKSGEVAGTQCGCVSVNGSRSREVM